MRDISDKDISEAAQGDRAAFERIYRAASGFVYNVAFRVIQHREEAEEVTQEVFVTLYRKLPAFRKESSLKTWVYRITVNTAINRVRQLARERSRRGDSFDEEALAQDSGSAPEAADQVQALLQRLNPDQRACLVLRGIEGWSYQQIAETLKINMNTVRSRIKRARENLLALRKEVTP